MRTIIVLLFALLLPAAAQTVSSNLEGRITVTEGRLPESLSIELVCEGRFVDRTPLNNDGSFAIRNIATGNYELRIIDRNGDSVRREYVNVGSHLGPVEIRIPGITEERPASGTVSVRELMQHVPREARKSLNASEKAYRRGDMQTSVSHLLRALETCADCVEVHNNLGTRYMRMGAFGDAVKAFQKAVELAPDSALTQANLAVALVTTKEFAAAEMPAKRALEYDSGSIPARYALGLSKLARQQCTQETVRHLRAAAELYPKAHLSAATALVCVGDKPGAVEELNAYLDTPNPEHRQRVEDWRTQLQEYARASE